MGIVTHLACPRCSRSYEVGPTFQGCPACASEGVRVNLVPAYDETHLITGLSRALGTPGDSMWHFSPALPVEQPHKVTLGEGYTSLVWSQQIGSWLGTDGVWVKDESRNPTWSHKDRQNSVAISHALSTGARVVTVASSGNHGASTAAYAAAAGLRCVIFTLPHAPTTLTSMMREYGAIVVATSRFEGRWKIMREAVEQLGWYPTGNFVSPPVGGNLYGIEGLKTIAYEVWQQLGKRAPDWIVAPSLLADILSGIGRGFEEIRRALGAGPIPRLVAVERFGPITMALKEHLASPVPVPSENTLAISIGGGQTTYHGLQAVRQSHGVGVTVSEDEILDARSALAHLGWLTEISSAAAFAGVRKLVADGVIGRDTTMVIVLTSSGMKDVGEGEQASVSVPIVEESLDHLEAVIAKHYGLNIHDLSGR